MPSHESDGGEGQQPTDIFSGIPKPEPELGGRRSRIEVMIHVLDAIRAGRRGPTRIMYRANLSWTICEGVLGHLAERGFIRVARVGTRRRYELTQAGIDLLDSFAKIAKALLG